MNQSSCQRLRTPSIAPASYRDSSMPCRPAMKARNEVPRLIHRVTSMVTHKRVSGLVSQRTGS